MPKKKITLEDLAGMTQRGFIEVHTEINGLRTEVRQEIDGVKQEVAGVKQEVAGVKREVREMKENFSELFTKLEGWRGLRQKRSSLWYT